MNGIFKADWLDVVFVHYRCNPAILQPMVPFELDLFDGDAYVSLVAFTQTRLRPTIGGRLSALLAAPLAQHEFLNIRTYVRHADRSGIFFLAEWIPNRLAQLIGPRLYGLPYRLGRLDYRGTTRSIRSKGRALEVNIVKRTHSQCDALSEFLVERYTAFTHMDGMSRRFDIEHAPWPLCRADVSIERSDLLEPYLRNLRPSCAHYSPGLRDVLISRPTRITSPAGRVRRSLYQRRRVGSVGCP